MYYYRFIFDFPLMPKPRGKVARNGHIYHNDKPYVEFTNKIIEVVKPTALWQRSGDPIKAEFSIGLFNGYCQTRGSQSDLDNLAGGILDSLKKASLVKDDNRTLWTGSYLKACRMPINYNLFILCDPMREDDMIVEIKSEYMKARVNV